MQIRNILKTSLITLAVVGSTWAFAGLVARLTTFSDGQVLTASQLNGEFNVLFNELNGSLTDANISASAAIDPKKLSSTIAGDGIARDGTTGVLSVNDDDSTLTITGDTLLIKDSGVTSAKILDATIATADYGAASVTQAKLATKPFATTTAAVGEICRTTHFAGSSTSSTGFVDVASCTITTTGNRPIFFMLHPRSSANGEASTVIYSATTGGQVSATIGVYEGATELFTQTWALSVGSAAVQASAPGFYVIRSTPTAAAHTYTFKIKVNTSSSTITTTGEFVVGEL